MASRDIVQFVELRKFLKKENTLAKEELAKEILFEIPGSISTINIFFFSDFVVSV